MSDDPVFEAWKDKARDADILSIGQELAGERGIRLRRSGHEWEGECPGCGGDDRFAINPGKRIFNCRKSKGGDVIQLVMHAKALPFVAACEWINKEPPPNGKASEPADPEALKEMREERRQAKREQQAQQDAQDEQSTAWATKLFGTGLPIKGTLAEVYLKKYRKLAPTDAQLSDFRFVQKLAYSGYADQNAKTQTHLGEYPAMLVAIRDVEGNIIGVHRTYLDPATGDKLKPPGYRLRNKAKKIAGKVMGGLIHLGAIGRAVAIGEGIETTLSFFELGDGPDDLTIASGGALGNISGTSTENLPHPTKEKETIQNGIPNMDSDAMILPPIVEEVYLLGDGDSDPIWTQARILTAARRLRAQGKIVFVCMAPDGLDFNDVLAEQRREEEKASRKEGASA